LLPMVSAVTQVYECGVLGVEGETYILQNDVSAAESCFLIHNHGIVFDLNGHTVTYGTNPTTWKTNCATYNSLQNGTICMNGIISDGDPRASQDFAPVSDWKSWNNVVIKNGNIVQSPNAGRYSNPLSGWGVNWTVANMSIVMHVTDATAIADESGGSGWLVADNDIQAFVDEAITNRHQWVPGIRVSGEGKVLRNSVVGVPHIGITGGHNSEIAYNYIAQFQRGANAFAVLLFGAHNVSIHDNIVNTTNGRGFMLDWGASYNEVYNNYLETQDQCVEGNEGCTGTYTMRIRGPSHDNYVHDNTFIAHSKDGMRATGLVLTPGFAEFGLDPFDLNNVIEHNVFIATSDGSNQANAAVFEANDDPNVHPGNIVRDNIFMSDNIVWSFWGANGPGFNNVLVNNTVMRGTHASSFLTLAYEGYTTGSRGNVFIDTNLIDASFDQAYYNFAWCVAETPCQFLVRWSVDVRVVDASDLPKSGASVDIRDKDGTFISHSVTDAQGWVHVQLDEFEGINGEFTYQSPYTFTVTSGSFVANQVLAVNRPMTLVFKTVTGCETPDGDGDGYFRVACGGADCDDADPAINPSAIDICQDGVDQSCSGSDDVCQACDTGAVPSRGCSCSGTVLDPGQLCAYPGDTIVIQGGFQGYDGAVTAEVWGQMINSTREWSSIRNVGSWTARDLVRFDLSGIPGLTVEQATVELLQLDPWHPLDRSNVTAYSVTRPWTKPGVTWICTNDVGQDGCVSPEIAWQGAGLTGAQDRDAITAVKVPVTPGQWNSWTITDIVQGWIDNPSSNHGLVFEEQDGLWQSFYDSLAEPSSKGPKLTITFAASPVVGCGSYDTDEDGTISNTELDAAVQDWYAARIDMSRLFNVAYSWLTSSCV
ncbi:MAG: DNRLRE domain-containing protein, partial [Nanoarchaeota archaeon]